MLKPYVFVGCEKVILDRASEDVPTLVALFTKVILTVPEGTEIPANAVAPREWTAYSNWGIEPGDELREYFLCTQIYYPNETPFGETNKSKMPIEANKRCQMALKMFGFPIGQIGTYIVRSWVEESGKLVLGPLEFGIDLEVRHLGQIKQSA